MPRSRREKVTSDNEEEEELLMEEDEEEEEVSPPKRARRKTTIEAEEDDEEKESNATPENTQSSIFFSSQAADPSQLILPVKDAELSNFMGMGEDTRQKRVSDVLRTVLFKSLAGQSINRPDTLKEAGVTEARISTAIYDEVNNNLENLFGFQMKRVPAYFEQMKAFPTRCKDRYYLVNAIIDQDGMHSKSMHKVHKTSSVEKGLLMIVLANIFSAGVALADSSRWLLDLDLYRLLNQLDENVPGRPPVQGSKRRRDTNHVEGTPDVDGALDRFVKMDYLLRVKAKESDQLMSMNEEAEDDSYFFAMGPRSVIEIGRRQVIHFISSTRTYALSVCLFQLITNAPHSHFFGAVDEETPPEILKEILDDEEMEGIEA
jgi:hypothetical protein